jgi:hypothetical protein
LGDGLVDDFLFSLGLNDSSNFLVVEAVGQRLCLQRSKFDQEVHATIRLRCELFVSVRLEDFGLERQNTNHETVHALQVEVEVVKCETLKFGLSKFINFHEVLIAHVIGSFSFPDLSEADPGDGLVFGEGWHLHGDL